ncbi:MAG TPA: DUF4276 family protein [Oscillatoriaceae cyanobacterium M33_DOE_052]|uniref:DUF4276 family protein n=1 Tax=Planktothricoides sp. SpSt-374 TaxID=2282167 RepID=A0A7C3ZW97_9CYAN|nr:DUF4276 family protein [Oscillatoriaceae cyanobacterium M33_DOE_052]
MVRLYLFAEGQTEQTFADNLLKPHLSQYEVLLHNPILIAHARKKGKVHRGGGRNYLAMKNDIQRLLRQEKAADVFFTTMIDLYAISAQFPGLSESEKLRQNPTERVEFLEQCFAEDIGDARFIPYIQLHEYEAYLFCDPTCFEFVYDNCSRQIAALKNIAAQHDNPELINDGQHTAPSKRIIAQFPAYETGKTADGSQLGELIGLEVIRSKCLHFNAWLSRLESLSGGDTAP